MKDILIIFCPPLSEYQDQPKDQSKCELIDCPTCKNKMWFSEKKKSMKQFAESLGKEILLECFTCFIKTVEKNPELLTDGVKIKI